MPNAIAWKYHITLYEIDKTRSIIIDPCKQVNSLVTRPSNMDNRPPDMHNQPNNAFPDQIFKILRSFGWIIEPQNSVGQV